MQISLNIHKWAVVLAYLALRILNHYPLVTRGYGIKFEHEFTHFQTPQKNSLAGKLYGDDLGRHCVFYLCGICPSEVDASFLKQQQAGEFSPLERRNSYGKTAVAVRLKMK